MATVEQYRVPSLDWCTASPSLIKVRRDSFAVMNLKSRNVIIVHQQDEDWAIADIVNGTVYCLSSERDIAYESQSDFLASFYCAHLGDLKKLDLVPLYTLPEGKRQVVINQFYPQGKKPFVAFQHVGSPAMSRLIRDEELSPVGWGRGGIGYWVGEPTDVEF